MLGSAAGSCGQELTHCAVGRSVALRHADLSWQGASLSCPACSRGERGKAVPGAARCRAGCRACGERGGVSGRGCYSQVGSRQHLLHRRPGGRQGAEVIQQAPAGCGSAVPKAERMHAYTIYVSALLPLFLLLAQGTFSFRPWDLPGLRLSNAFKVSRHLPAPRCHGARYGVCREQLSPRCAEGRGLAYRSVWSGRVRRRQGLLQGQEERTH